MANTSAVLYNNGLATTTLTAIYTPTSNEVGKNLWLTLTNTTSTNNTASVYINNGSSDQLIELVNIPAGSGRCVVVSKLAGHNVSGGSSNSVKIQLGTASNINVVLSGIKETS